MSREIVQISVEILAAHCGSYLTSDKTIEVSTLQHAITGLESLSTRYPLHLQITGTFSVSCPDCGHIQKHRLNWNTWKVRCRYRNCRVMIVFGIHGALIRAPGRLKRKPRRPPDTMFPELPVI